MAEDTVKKTAAPKKPPVTEEDPFEIVQVKLHQDRNHMEPLFVSVNEFKDKIPRGVWYPVPRYVAKHIEESEAQDRNTMLIIAGLKDEFERKAAAFGVEI